MSTQVKSGVEGQSFAETAMRLSGKTDDEARRIGAVDKADDQVESLFESRYQTANSPVHKGVWEEKVPLDLFMPPALAESAPCDAAMDRSFEIVKKHRLTNTLYDENGKVSPAIIGELGKAGYWGMLIDQKYGGQGAPFARFSRFLTRIATMDPMVAGFSSVHGCIGAVDPVRTFGTPEQKQRFLPKLASGESLSAFALTEPCAGSDLTALRTTAVRVGDAFEVTGEKLFITNAIPGRTIGLVVMLDGKPAVLIAELPPTENETFRIVPYGIYALRNAHNNGLRFNRFRVPAHNLLKPNVGDGLTIGYHGLNLGRLALCANAAGTMRILLTNMMPWADFRWTYGQKIKTRELVKRRTARLAALICGADALVDWGSWLIDQGYRGELECVIAKIFGSEALKEAAIELFMKSHGGRSFLHGHIFGDNVYDFLAPCIYEGEGEMLGLAFFKSMVKHHGKLFFEPIGKALERTQIRAPKLYNPMHVWALRREFGAYGKWVVGQKFKSRDRQSISGMDPRMSRHISYALDLFGGFAARISGTMQKFQLGLADRQCRMAELSQRVQDTVVLLTTALWGHRQTDVVSRMAADILCQDITRKLTGAPPSDRYFADCVTLADLIIERGWKALGDAPQADILMPYSNKSEKADS